MHLAKARASKAKASTARAKAKESKDSKDCTDKTRTRARTRTRIRPLVSPPVVSVSVDALEPETLLGTVDTSPDDEGLVRPNVGRDVAARAAQFDPHCGWREVEFAGPPGGSPRSTEGGRRLCEGRAVRPRTSSPLTLPLHQAGELSGAPIATAHRQPCRSLELQPTVTSHACVPVDFSYTPEPQIAFCSIFCPPFRGVRPEPLLTFYIIFVQPSFFSCFEHFSRRCQNRTAYYISGFCPAETKIKPQNPQNP